VAVLMVVIEHVGLIEGRGLGGTGVAMFFGLSGYLITGLLFDERARNGRVRLGAFYVRRAARLLPGLLLMLLMCDALFLHLGRNDVLRSSLYAFFYVANYATIFTGNYLPGYGQTWSLAIEEHFYLVWPVVLLFSLPRRSLTSLIRWTLLACVATLAWRCLLVLGTDAGPLLLHHGTLERADALLYGCAAALAVRDGWRPCAWMGWFAAVGLAIISVVGDYGSFGVTIVQALTGALSALLVVSLDYLPDALRRALSFGPLTWLGVVSYSVYLWHSPLIVLTRGFGLTGIGYATLAGFVATPIVAAVSYYGFESPIRAFVRRQLDSAPMRLTE
jgi:peptidoglycan/LPS O-acetylase OafA/YrhL